MGLVLRLIMNIPLSSTRGEVDTLAILKSCWRAMDYEFQSAEPRSSAKAVALVSPRLKRFIAILVRLVLLIALPTTLFAVTILVASLLSR